MYKQDLVLNNPQGLIGIKPVYRYQVSSEENNNSKKTILYKLFFLSFNQTNKKKNLMKTRMKQWLNNNTKKLKYNKSNSC